MRAMSVGIVLLLLIFVGGAWFLRYEYLAPVTYTEPARYPNDPPHRAVVVCRVDRWTNSTRCDQIQVDAVTATEEMERWLREQKK